jgi:hypothetical protein
MLDTHAAAAQEVDRYAAHGMAAVAASKAKRLWPNAIGEVLADEIMALLDLPPWLRFQTRTQRLIDAILDIPEGTAGSCDGNRPHAAATPNKGTTRAA